MKKLIPIILLLCIFTNNCHIIRRIEDDIDSSFASYRIVQQYNISASRNKTYVQASVYYWQFRHNRKPKYISKIKFNGIEMKKGILKYFRNNESPCAAKQVKTVIPQSSAPQSTISPELRGTPEPPPQESDFYIELDEFRTENTIEITNPDNEIEMYTLKLDPIRFENPESVKISRTKNNVIKMLGKSRGEKDDILLYLTQGNGIFIDQNKAPFDPAKNVIKLPSYLTEQFKKGALDFSILGRTKGFIKASEQTTEYGYSLAYGDEVCAEIVD